jgi:aspartate/methionine/tyrosine aminotransferase
MVAGVEEEAPVLEAWYRQELDKAVFDISSSGVAAYTFGELQKILALDSAELDAVRLDDGCTLGAPALRKAIAARYARGNHAGVMTTHGSSEAISLVLSNLLEPNDNVIILAPIYHSLRDHALQGGCQRGDGLVRISWVP